MTNDTVDFLKLMDSKALAAFAKSELIRTINSIKENDFSDEVKDKIVKEFRDELPETDEKVAKKKAEIKKKKTSGIKDRRTYLGVVFRYFDGFFVGLAVILTYIVMKRRDKYIDMETGLFNAEYLDCG